MTPIIPTATEGFDLVVLAKDQPEYLPLPALRNNDGDFITEWIPSAEELAAILNGKPIRMIQLTFNHPFQPIHIGVLDTP
jgi:hypothetical protein